MSNINYLEWQEIGGSITIPKDWFVSKVNLDSEEPYVMIESLVYMDAKPVKLPFPKSLAYYLRTHFCGSQAMHDLIADNTRRDIKNTIKQALGI